jgi:hypothetical protein
MEELIDLIATNGAPSEVTNKIKELLYVKAADRVDAARPEIASMMFGDNQAEEIEDAE